MAIGSFVGYAPAMFCYSLYGNLLDKYPGFLGYRLVFIVMACFAVLGLLITSYLVKMINDKKNV